jgi:hypothetical protein
MADSLIGKPKFVVQVKDVAAAIKWAKDNKDRLADKDAQVGKMTIAAKSLEDEEKKQKKAKVDTQLRITYGKGDLDLVELIEKNSGKVLKRYS